MTARVNVRFDSAEAADRDYQIVIGEGLLEGIAEKVTEVCDAHRYVVISDSRVAGLYGSAVVETLAATGRSADLLEFPEGEVNKTRESWADLSDRMLDLGVGRDAAVIALGGGVTGDLAGFVAATYLRGLPLVQVPTSLLAMIDSSVGGKTGVDTGAGKNLIGAFLQPRGVIADVATLATLAGEHLRGGLAEALKHGAIADADYFAWIAEARERILALDADALVPLIERSVQLKADVVGRDEREGGLRKTLNFGHTIGHAVESASDFRLLHGEAIAIGMVAEARLGEMLGITRTGTADQLADVFATFDLPVSIPESMEHSRIVELTHVDKKARGGQVEYALIERIGRVSRGSGSYGHPVDDGVVGRALSAEP